MRKHIPTSLVNSGPFDLLAERHDTKINVVGCKEAGPGLLAMLLRVDGRLENEMLIQLRRIPGVRRVYSPAYPIATGALVMVVADAPRAVTPRANTPKGAAAEPRVVPTH